MDIWPWSHTFIAIQLFGWSENSDFFIFLFLLFFPCRAQSLLFKPIQTFFVYFPFGWPGSKFEFRGFKLFFSFLFFKFHVLFFGFNYVNLAVKDEIKQVALITLLKYSIPLRDKLVFYCGSEICHIVFFCYLSVLEKCWVSHDLDYLFIFKDFALFSGFK
jgi:hypothetical protein